MSKNEMPDWYDESKIIHCTLANPLTDIGYSGPVQDMGDGTARLVMNPLLGEDAPKFGDRVDLFYFTGSPFERPFIGYRAYEEGVEPTGRHFALKREPTKEEIEERGREEKRREQQECERISANYEAMFGQLGAWKANMSAGAWMLRYFELKSFAKEGGLEIPEDFHERINSYEFDRDDRLSVEVRRKELKTMMLAVLKTHFDDVEVDDSEVEKLVKGYTNLSEEANILRQKVCEQIRAMEPAEEEES